MNELDCLPEEAGRYAEIERAANNIARFYGFEKIVPAPLESAAAFAPLIRAGLLEERPPVQCKTRNGEELLLSPSGALGAVRAYFTHKMQTFPHPVKLFYHTRGFSLPAQGSRRPLRQPTDGGEDSGGSPIAAHDEWGLVMIGEEGPVAETEIAQVFYRTTGELGINDHSIELRINAVGCSTCRGAFRSSLANYFRRHALRLCTKSKRDLKRAPARILSCTDERCRGAAGGAPQVLDFLCERCKKQLRSLLEFLDEAKIPYFLDARLFREGSWYTEIVYELRLDRVKASPDSAPPAGGAGDARVPAGDPPAGGADERDASGNGTLLPEAAGQAPDTRPQPKFLLAEGGRISHAAALLGAKELPVASGTFFIDAVAAAIKNKEAAGRGGAEVFFVQLGELAKRRSFEILECLREGEIGVKESLGRDSIKTQLKIAERLASRYALILGQKEALDDTIIVREVESGIQETVPQEKLVEFLKKKLKK